jgi:hypothetical protein
MGPGVRHFTDMWGVGMSTLFKRLRQVTRSGLFCVNFNAVYS